MFCTKPQQYLKSYSVMYVVLTSYLAHRVKRGSGNKAVRNDNGD